MTPSQHAEKLLELDGRISSDVTWGEYDNYAYDHAPEIAKAFLAAEARISALTSELAQKDEALQRLIRHMETIYCVAVRIPSDVIITDIFNQAELAIEEAKAALSAAPPSLEEAEQIIAESGIDFDKFSNRLDGDIAKALSAAPRDETCGEGNGGEAIDEAVEQGKLHPVFAQDAKNLGYSSYESYLDEECK